jgi:hypothetical protein
VQSFDGLMVMSFVGTITVLVVDEIVNYHVVPRPSRMIGASLVYLMLGLASPIISAPVAAMISFGMFLTLLYQYFAPGTEKKFSSGIEKGLRAQAPGD